MAIRLGPGSSWLVPEDADLPDWLPLGVRRMALQMPIEEHTLKILTDPRMKSVWAQLRRQKLTQEALENPASEFHRDVWCDWTSFGDAESSCAAFYERASLIYFWNPMSRSVADAEIEEYRQAANLLQRLERSLLPTPELENAIPLVRGHLQGIINHKQSLIDRFTLPRSAKLRGDDTVRLYGRGVGRAMLELYGSPLYGTAATVVSIVSGSNVTAKQMENWTKAVQ